MIQEDLRDQGQRLPEDVDLKYKIYERWVHRPNESFSDIIDRYNNLIDQNNILSQTHVKIAPDITFGAHDIHLERIKTVIKERGRRCSRPI